MKIIENYIQNYMQSLTKYHRSTETDSLNKKENHRESNRNHMEQNRNHIEPNRNHIEQNRKLSRFIEEKRRRLMQKIK